MEEVKTCTKCGEPRPLSRYRLLKNGRYGTQCKTCLSAIRADYRKSRPLARKDESRKRYLRHKAAVLESNKLWKTNNPDKEKSIRSRYRQRNAEKLGDYKRRYTAEHSHQIKASNARYRAENTDKVERQRKLWNSKNQVKIDEKNRRYRHQIASELHDRYVKNLLQQGTALKTHQVPQSIVKLKREQLKTHRATRKLISTIKEKHNGTK